MAKIPLSNFNRGISEDVPRVAAPSVSQAGIAFEGLARVGRGVSDLGAGLQQLKDRRDKAASDSFLNTVQSDFNRDNAEQLRDSKAFYEGSSYEGYAEERRKFIEDQKDFYTKKAPNDLARRRAEQYFGRVMDESVIKDPAFENRQASQFYLNQDNRNRTKRSDTLFEYPSLDKAAEAYAELNSNASNSELYNPDQKLKEIDKNKDVIKATLDGMLNSGGAHLSNGKAFVEGRTEFRGMLQALDPRERARYKKKFDSAIRTELNKNVQNLSAEAADLTATLDLGQSRPEDKRRLNEIINTFEGLKEIEGVNKSAIAGKLSAMKTVLAVSEDRENFKNRNLNDIVSDKAAIISEAKNVKTVEDAQVFKRRVKFVDDYIKQAKNDPAGLSLSENSLLKEGTQELYDYQVSRNMPNPSYFSKQESENIRTTFKTSPTPREDLKQFLAEGDIKAKKKWLNSEGNQDAFMAKMSLAAEFQNKLTQGVLLMSPSEVAKTNETFASRPEAVGITNKDINNSLNKFNEDFRQAFDRPGQAPFFDAMMDASRTRTKQLMIQGLSLSEASEQANKEIIESNYSFIPNGEDKIPLTGKFRNPKNSNKLTAFIESYGSSLSEEGTIRDLRIDHTANSTDPKFKSTKGFMEEIEDLEGKLELSDDGEGFVISHIHPVTGKRQKLKTWHQNADGTRSHVDLVVPFDDIVSQGSQYEKALNKELGESEVVKRLTGPFKQFFRDLSGPTKALFKELDNE